MSSARYSTRCLNNNLLDILDVAPTDRESGLDPSGGCPGRLFALADRSEIMRSRLLSAEATCNREQP
jgi:hypothetical protein